jgi:hypothetical protein
MHLALPSILTRPVVHPQPHYQTTQHGRVRVYFIAADELDWDYAPSGQDDAIGPFV